MKRHVIVTGGCGYVGTILVPKLATEYKVTVLDSMLFGNHLLSSSNVNIINGDIRDTDLIDSLLPQTTDIIHLASIANDPCSDLDPKVTNEVNRDAVDYLAKAAKKAGVQRFINASSSSVYGLKEEENVTEDLSLNPLTLYAKLKAETEQIIGALSNSDFATVSIRSATVCGISRRMRFDVIVNILTKSAIADGVITVHGGDQYRPNVHIEDITDLYVSLMKLPQETINGKIYNFGSINHTVTELANMVHEETGATIHTDSNVTDNRSYRISSNRIYEELGLKAQRPIQQAVRDIKTAFDAGMFPKPDESVYYNIETMKGNIGNS